MGARVSQQLRTTIR